MSSIEKPYNLCLKIKGFEKSQLIYISSFIISLALFCGGTFHGKNILPCKKKHISLLRSPHIHKKSRTQLVYRSYKILLFFKYSNIKLVEEILFFLKTSYLPGVECQLCLSEKTYIF